VVVERAPHDRYGDYGTGRVVAHPECNRARGQKETLFFGEWTVAWRNPPNATRFGMRSGHPIRTPCRWNLAGMGRAARSEPSWSGGREAEFAWGRCRLTPTSVAAASVAGHSALATRLDASLRLATEQTALTNAAPWTARAHIASGAALTSSVTAHARMMTDEADIGERIRPDEWPTTVHRSRRPGFVRLRRNASE
jgi:hypothetical protein